MGKILRLNFDGIHHHENYKDSIMNNRRILTWTLIALFLIISTLLLFLGINKDDVFLTVCSSLSSMGLLCAAVYGFRSARGATRLQTSLEFSFVVYKELHKKSFKERERFIQNKLSTYKGEVCAIDDIEDQTLRGEIHKYCGYMDGIGILVMEHLIKPEIILYNTGVGLLRTYCLLKPFLDASRQKRYEMATHDINDGEVDKIISNSVRLYYAHFELLALEMLRQGPKLIKIINAKLKRAQRGKRII